MPLPASTNDDVALAITKDLSHGEIAKLPVEARSALRTNVTSQLLYVAEANQIQANRLADKA